MSARTAPKTKANNGAFKEPVAVEQLPVKTEPEVVPDGDFAGMTYDEVLELSMQGVHDAIGELTLEGCGAVLDMTTAQVLELTRHYQGDFAAKCAALRFISTCMPYAELDCRNDPGTRSLKDLRKEYIKRKSQ